MTTAIATLKSHTDNGICKTYDCGCISGPGAPPRLRFSHDPVFWHAHPGGAQRCARIPGDGWYCPYMSKREAEVASKTHCACGHDDETPQ